MVVMGGGVVGVEMSQAFQTLGCQVTLIEGARRLLPNEEEFACVAAHRGAARATASSIRTAQQGRPRSSRPSDGTVTVHDGRRQHGARARSCWSRSAGSRSTQGRRPRDRRTRSPARSSRSTRTCACPATTGCTRSATSTARALFTHMGKYQARLAADHLLGHDHVLSARRGRPALPARDLHRAAGRGGRPHDARRRSRRAWSSTSIETDDVRQRGRLLLRPQRARHDRAGSSTASAGSSSAARSRAPRSPTSCTRRRSRSSARCRSSRLRHAVPAFPTRSRDLAQARAALKKSTRREPLSSLRLPRCADLGCTATTTQLRFGTIRRPLRNFDGRRTLWYDAHRTSRRSLA